MKYALAVVASLAILSSCSSSSDKPAEETKKADAAKPAAQPAGEGSILRVDPSFDALVPAGAKIENFSVMLRISE